MTESNRPYSPRARRIPVQIPITVSTMGMFLDSQIMNLSKGGVFMKADIPLPTGSLIDFEFLLPQSGQKIRVSGTVVWSRKSGVKSPASFPPHPSGMGVQFQSMSVEEVEAILDEIEQLMDISQ